MRCLSQLLEAGDPLVQGPPKILLLQTEPGISTSRHGSDSGQPQTDLATNTYVARICWSYAAVR